MGKEESSVIIRRSDLDQLNVALGDTRTALTCEQKRCQVLEAKVTDLRGQVEDEKENLRVRVGEYEARVAVLEEAVVDLRSSEANAVRESLSSKSQEVRATRRVRELQDQIDDLSRQLTVACEDRARLWRVVKDHESGASEIERLRGRVAELEASASHPASSDHQSSGSDVQMTE